MISNYLNYIMLLYQAHYFSLFYNYVFILTLFYIFVDFIIFLLIAHHELRDVQQNFLDNIDRSIEIDFFYFSKSDDKSE